MRNAHKSARILGNQELVILSYRAGLSAQMIGQKIGCKAETVRKYLRLWGEYQPPSFVGEKNPAWRGGRMLDKHGYVLLYMPDHPDANRHGQVREHRIVMEKMIGRRLLKTEVVHHKNDQRGDNRPENLELFETNGRHLAETLTGVPCPARGRKRIPSRVLSEAGGAKLLEMSGPAAS